MVESKEHSQGVRSFLYRECRGYTYLALVQGILFQHKIHLLRRKGQTNHLGPHFFSTFRCQKVPLVKNQL